MSKLNEAKVMPRYMLVSVLMTLVSCCVLGKAFYIMTAEKDYWAEAAKQSARDSVKLEATRGNILSCDGRLMATTMPQYKIFMDFETLRSNPTDTAFADSLDAICQGLNEIFPEKPAEEFKAELKKGYAKRSRVWPVWKKRVDYDTWMEVSQLPVFRRGVNKSGIHADKFTYRQHPFGSLAGRTIGDLYKEQYGGRVPRCGLEMAFDSVLRGKEGIGHSMMVRSKFLTITDVPPENGSDVVTTIDVNMQDLAERSVVDELKLIGGKVGVAIVMEVATGDIKAMVNMQHCDDGEYREIANHAVSDLLEPGSVFKTASIMAALDDGYVDTTYMVETGGGVWNMYGRDMKDHNWSRGGYGTLMLPWTLKYSSNIGVSRIIDKFYHDQPEKFVQKIHSFGLATDYKVPIPGYVPGIIRMPKKNKRGQYTNWSKTALPWMSIGYETQVPPLQTVTFYNAIANGGKLVRPRLVKAIMRDGEVVQEFPVQVVKEQIAKPQTIEWIQRILREVVSEGLGKKAGSDKFEVAGKTGTAQMSKGALGYKAGGTNYLLSFAGYFPADNPRYSCIVCIQKEGLPASGGGMSGVVFHNIAEGIMSQILKVSMEDARDSSSVLLPRVKEGDLHAADFVLHNLGFDLINGWKGYFKCGDPVWGAVDDSTTRNRLTLVKGSVVGQAYVPDVCGMGARDAVYLMESRGIKARINGRGVVVSQSLAPGTRIRSGMSCNLALQA